LKQNCMGSPLGAAKYNSLLQGAASLDRMGTTALKFTNCWEWGIVTRNGWVFHVSKVVLRKKKSR